MSDSGQIYLEFNQIGNTMEVRAVDARDGLEVSFIAPSKTPESEIVHIARNKLGYVRRKIETSSGSQGTASTSKKSDTRRGIIV